jgi:spoIIIJ-associated protein
MSEEITKLEVIAPSVEEAIEKGLHELGLTEEDIDVDILDEGKAGLFGLGSRQARIALKIKKPPQASVDQEKKSPTPQKASAVPVESPLEAVADDAPEEVVIARETIQIILEKMRVDAKVSVKLGDSESNRVQPVLIDIEGNDLSFLIGRKGETINALQYITSLIVGRELGRWLPIQVDVQHYRKRREDELRRLARRIAEQVIGTGRMQILEPMPSNERRIIHIELRDNPNVDTQSVGEGDQRKVTVRPKD